MSPPRVLIVRLSHLGDVVCALPLYHALRAAWPDARIAWVTQREYVELVGGLRGLERVIEFDRRGGARAWLALRAATVPFDPTLVVDAQGNWKSAFVALAAGSGRRVGLARRHWQAPLAASAMHELATDRAMSPHAPVDHPPVDRAPVDHAVERELALARALIGGEIASPRFDPDPSPRELADGRAHVERWFPERLPAVVLSLGDPGDPRSWPIEAFAALARSLASSGSQVLALSGPAEASVGRALELELAATPRVRHWVGQRGLRELVGFLASLAREREACFVSADSGPMHLAWSCGLRVALLAGPQDAARTGPWPLAPKTHAVVRAAIEPSCAPCLARTCAHPRGPICMRDLDPARVERALTAIAAARRAP